ncbi:MAG: peptidoglycan DD-metalloendopeptidase family protein [Acidobacteriia bacterium]|nr:peptidoglycan DD-metalloendopeptidase family protein [Terriglobia bacterium]
MGITWNQRFKSALLAVLAAGAATLGYAVHARSAAARAYQQEVALAREEGAWIRLQPVLRTVKRLPYGENFASALEEFGLSGEEAAAASAAAQQAFDLRQLRAGNFLTVGRSGEGRLRAIEYRIDPERLLRIVPGGERYTAEVRTIESRTEMTAVSGTLEDSLFNAVEQAGETAELAMRMAEIFGYDLDFYTDPRRGDTFRVVMEKKKYTDGSAAGYGRILAAEYVNGGRTYRAVLFHDSSGRPAYYGADGASLQKIFLRSPLKFGARITSHFSNDRLHPILKTHHQHLGIDYGAPVGTPVQAIGSGRVLVAGQKPGEGNYVHLRHSGGYETKYLHLSKMFVHAGEQVEIGKTIGLVGSTGLSTGPHLDFRFLQRGQYRNFEHLGLPPADPVSKENWAEFQTVREKWLPMLEHPEMLRAGRAPVAGVPGTGGQ